MGNNCICLKNTGSLSEIFTPAKTEAAENNSSVYCYKSSEINRKQKDNKAEAEDTSIKESQNDQSIIKAKAAPAPENQEASVNYKTEDNNNNKSFDRAMTKDTKEFYDEPPQLVQFPSKEDYLDYAMDLFDQVNKYRADPELFADLMKKYPSQIFF